MAVVLGKSGVISNMETVPVVQAEAAKAGGTVKLAAGVVELANGDSIASVFKVCRIPSNAFVRRVLMYCDAITSGAADIGCYYAQPTRLGGQVATVTTGLVAVDADVFATAQSIASALVVGTDVTHEATATNIDKLETPLWQLCGLTSDPQVDFDVCLTLTAATTAAGTVALQVLYTDNR
jgi:hypothetical protein